MSCITTFTMKSVDPIHALAEDMDIRDIAHALSLLCRANGHFPQFYSVAQHCLNCAREAKARGYSERVQLACLLHDAAEAYMADMPRPVKQMLPEYCRNEEKLLTLIWGKWLEMPLTENECEQVFSVDDALLYHEFLHFMDQKVICYQQIKNIPQFDWQPFERIEQEYLHTFEFLSESDQHTVYVGVDGYDGKWIAAVLKNGKISVHEYADISTLCKEQKNADCILIDVPIGLPDTPTEILLRPDQPARDYLSEKNRKSSVFNTPVRSAVYAETKEEAQEVNQIVSGKRLSLQSLAIVPIIRQVDTFLQTNPMWKNKLRESHPELAFQTLNHGNPIKNPKYSTAGITERISILKEYCPDVEKAVNQEKKNKVNDILDAVCLAVTAQRGSENGFVTVPTIPSADRTGLLMQMVLCKTV